MKKTVILLLIIFFQIPGAIAFEDFLRKEFTPMSENDSALKAAKNYIAILSKIGDCEDPCSAEKITDLCAPNCKKVRNGKVLFEGRDLFADQLNGGKEWLGSWQIEICEIVVSSSSLTAVIHYKLTTEKEGELMVMVILHYDSTYKIEQINEVHNQLEK